MKEVGLIFQAWGIRAILEGRKDVTRRIMKPQPKHGPVFQIEGDKSGDWYIENFMYPRKGSLCEQRWKCPYPKGAMMWVRETWGQDYHGELFYKADHAFKPSTLECDKWRSPLYMPRDIARIVVPILDCYPVWVPDISEEEAKREGCESVEKFIAEWNKINGPDSWRRWAWQIEFGKVKK